MSCSFLLDPRMRYVETLIYRSCNVCSLQCNECKKDWTANESLQRHMKDVIRCIPSIDPVAVAIKEMTSVPCEGASLLAECMNALCLNAMVQEGLILSARLVAFSSARLVTF